MNHTSTSIRMRQKAKWGRLFVLPACLIIFCFVVYPLVYTFYLSFTDYNFAYDLKPTFVGLKNYIDMFKDKLFLQALSNTLLLSAISFVLMMVISLALALLLYKKTRHSWFYRTSIFMPIVVPASLVCLLFSWMLGNNFGIVNKFLINIGLPKLVSDWLTSPNTAKGCVVAVSLWNKVGFCTILFLSGLQGISKDILEAADLDGATGFKKLFHIILPSLSETFVVVGIWAVLQTLKLFVTPMVLTSGGPANATQVLYMYIYKTAFLNYDMGYAAAMSFVFSIIVMVFALLNMKLSTRED